MKVKDIISEVKRRKKVSSNLLLLDSKEYDVLRILLKVAAEYAVMDEKEEIKETAKKNKEGEEVEENVRQPIRIPFVIIEREVLDNVYQKYLEFLQKVIEVKEAFLFDAFLCSVYWGPGRQEAGTISFIEKENYFILPYIAIYVAFGRQEDFITINGSRNGFEVIAKYKEEGGEFLPQVVESLKHYVSKAYGRIVEVIEKMEADLNKDILEDIIISDSLERLGE
jgi:hypothetical protein